MSKCIRMLAYVLTFIDLKSVKNDFNKHEVIINCERRTS